MVVPFKSLCPWHQNICAKMGGIPDGAFFRTVLIVSALMCLVPLTSSHDLKFEKHIVEMRQPSEPLALLWGIADTTAYVGKLFTYTLPSDAFQGNIIHYNITKVGEKNLPSWLTFNALRTELSGIPGPADKGQIYLEVKAIGDDNSKADDVFSIEILEDSFGNNVPSSNPAGENTPKHVRCRREEPQTTITVILDCDVDLMKAGDKMNVLNNMVSHLNLAPEMLKLLPIRDKPMFDSSALVVGPGNVKEPKSAGSIVSWLVGCGKVENDHMPVLQLVESSAANGDMKGALGHDVVGWHVTNTRFQQKQRKKRAAFTATPAMTIPPPTKMSEMGSSSSASIAASSVQIMPTKTVEVQPTQMPTKPTKMVSSSSSSLISPSETVKMEETDKPTAEPVPTDILPSKTYTMTSEVMTETKVMPTSTTTTTTATTVPTMPPTTKPTTPKPTTPAPTTTTKPTTEKPATPEPLCPKKIRGMKKAPMIKNPLKNLTIPAGAIKKIKIPEDTFFDCYDEKTSNLAVDVTQSSGKPLPKGFWMKVVRKNNKPVTILANPLNTQAGSYSFKLKATNTYNKVNSQDFNIIVLGEDMADEAPNHEISMTIDTDYEAFMSDMDNRIELSKKISAIYGDSNSRMMTVTRIASGSVVYAWTNNSLAGSGCPVEDLKNNMGKMFNEDGTLTTEAQETMKPYTIKSAASVPLGSCTGNPNFPKRSMRRVKITTEQTKTTVTDPSTKMTEKKMTPSKTMPESTTKAKVAAAGAGGGGSDIWISTVVPAIVVVVVLIIAIIVACCLYRKKRKGKMKLDEQKNSFSNNKGVPVIFADEYDEKPNESTRPLIMEDEKPPMPPPEYQRASSETSGNSNSTQPIEDKDAEEIEMDTDITSPLYSPPPPVTASNNSKPPHVQSARGPPPYVPP